MRRPKSAISRPVAESEGEPLPEAHYEQRNRAAPRQTKVALTVREAVVTPAPQLTRERIAAIRDKLELSQSLFAQALNVSTETVRAWEQGKRTPDGASLRLLELAELHPQWVLRSVRDTSEEER